MFENGVKFYTTGQAVINVPFPENEIRCGYCAFCRPEADLKRFWCRLTNKMIYNPYAGFLPEWCPIKFEKE